MLFAPCDIFWRADERTDVWTDMMASHHSTLLEWYKNLTIKKKYFTKNINVNVVADSGHFMNMLFSASRSGFTAKLQSAYMNTTGKCIELFYMMKSSNQLTTLSVKTISEELEEAVTGSTMTTTSDWGRLYFVLPDGTNRISIEGYRDIADVGGCQISIDDIIIRDCSNFGKLHRELINYFFID